MIAYIKLRCVSLKYISGMMKPISSQLVWQNSSDSTNYIAAESN